jgi:trigger factor
VQARDRVLEAILDEADVPIPEHVLGDEVSYRHQSMEQQLAAAGMTKEQYASFEDKSVEDLEQEIADGAKQAIKAQFVLDAIARKEELTVNEAELTDQIVRRALQAGMRADQYANEVVNSGQLGSLMSEVLRGKALALALEHAKIRDADGNEIDLDELTEQFAAPGEDAESEDVEPDEVSSEPAEETPAL